MSAVQHQCCPFCGYPYLTVFRVQGQKANDYFFSVRCENPDCKAIVRFINQDVKSHPDKILQYWDKRKPAQPAKQEATPVK